MNYTWKIVAVFFFLAPCVAPMLGQYDMLVHLNDGNTETFDINVVRSIKFNVQNDLSVFSEDFNSAPTGWTTENFSVGGATENASWTQRPNDYAPGGWGSFTTPDASGFMLSNSDAQGSQTVTTFTILSSPSFSTLNLSSAIISLNHHFAPYTGSGIVEVSLNGTDWEQLTVFNSEIGTTMDFVTSTVPVPADYLNQAEVFIRFYYQDEWGFWWAINQVNVIGTAIPAMIVNRYDGTAESWSIPLIDFYEFQETTNNAVSNSTRSVGVLNVFPNPAVSEISIDLSTPATELVLIEILNAAGMRVHTVYSGMHQGSRQYYRTLALAPGIYHCKVQSQRRSITKPFIVQ